MTEDLKKLNLTSNAALIVITVEKVEDGVVSGNLYNAYLPMPIPFTSLESMLIKMNGVYDRLGYPQAGFEMRSFYKAESVKNQEPLQQYWDIGTYAEGKGTKAVFYVQVRYRQQATWQGTVVWREGRREENFRSALELLFLIHSALEADVAQLELVN